MFDWFVLFQCVCIYFIFFYYYSLEACLFSNVSRNSLGSNERGGEEELGGIERGKILIRVCYNEKKTSIFNKKNINSLKG